MTLTTSFEPTSDPTTSQPRNALVAGRSVRLSLPRLYWTMLEDIARREGMPLDALVDDAASRSGTGARPRALECALRVLAVGYHRVAAPPDRGGLLDDALRDALPLATDRGAALS